MKKWLKIVIDVVAWILIVFSACLTIIVFTSNNDIGVPNIFGNMLFTIQTESMEPTIHKGDLIFVKGINGDYTDEKNLKVNDVATFWTTINGEKAINTHRVIAIDKADNGEVVLTTMGDGNNGLKDVTPVRQADIIGKYTGKRIVGAGAILDYLKTSSGFFICVILPLILFFLYELFIFVKTVSDRNREKATAELSEKEEDIKRRAIEEYLSKQQAQSNEPSVQSDKPSDETDKKD